jgi:hypothetical protein
LLQDGVAREQPRRHCLRLRHQHAVEWITVVVGQKSHAGRNLRRQ